MPNPYVNGIQNGNQTIDIYDAALRSTIGQSNGIATLDNNGKLTASQLPSDSNKLDTTTLALSGETEATTTASKAHAKDSKFYLAATGEYCMAKTAIAIGDTLVKDTNYQVISINGFLTDLETYLILAGQMLDTKADKVTSATNGNLAGLNGSGNPTDSGWNGAKDTTSISGNPISISGLKSNQLAVNPIITLEPIQDLHGQSKPYPAGGGKNLIPLTVEQIKSISQSGSWSGNTFTPSGSSGTITIVTDVANNVIGLKVNGTFSNTIFYLFGGWYGLSKGTSYIINGGSSTASVRITDNVTNTYADYTGAGTTFTLGNDFNTPTGFLYINAGTWSNVIVKPMICLAAESDTTFAPYENICPISGYDKIEVLSCGKNIFDKDIIELGGIDQTTGEDVPSTSIYRTKGYINVKSGGTYYISGLENTAIRVFRYVGNTFLTSGVYYTDFAVTFDDGTTKIRMQGASLNDKKGIIQIELGSTPTTYVPYVKATSISESLGQMVYGGTLDDVRTGVFTVTHGVVDLGTLSWAYYNNYYAELTNMKKLPALQTSLDKCSMYNVEYNGNSQTHNDKNYVIYAENNTLNIFIRDTTVSSASDLVTKVTGQKLVYELATPFTIQLTPHEISLLKDYAYVSTNGTTIALDYHNGELASLADVSQLGETVNELGDYVQHNKTGGDTTITSYTSADNPFIFPNDGYVNLDSASVSSGNIRVVIQGANGNLATNIYMNITGTYQRQGVYVRKGMKAYVAGIASGASVRFIPFIP